MIGRFCLYVEVEGESVAHAIGLALTTVEQEKRWHIRITGVHYEPDPVGLMPGGGVLGTPVMASTSSGADPSTRLLSELLDFVKVAKKGLRDQQPPGEDWRGEADEP